MKCVQAYKVVVETVGRACRIRTDNGPGTSAAAPTIAAAVIPGVGMCTFDSDGRVREAARSERSNEARRYYNRGIGGWRTISDLPPAPAPGLAFRGSCRENPAPCGGGLMVAYGKPAPVQVEVFLSDWDTRRPHPAYPQRFAEVND